MPESWISLPLAIERVRNQKKLPIGATHMLLTDAFASGSMRTRWEGFQGVRGGEAGTRPAIERSAWVGASILESDLMMSADGIRRRGIAVSEADFAAWLGKNGAPPTTLMKTHVRYVGDDILVQEIADGLLAKKWPNQHRAAIEVVQREGLPDAAVRRLERKVSEIVKTSQNISKDARP